MHLISDGNCLVKTIQRLRTAIFQWGLHNIQLETTTLLSSPKRVLLTYQTLPIVMVRIVLHNEAFVIRPQGFFYSVSRN